VLWQSGADSMTSTIRSGPDPVTSDYSLEIIDLSENLMVSHGGSWQFRYGLNFLEDVLDYSGYPVFFQFIVQRSPCDI